MIIEIQSPNELPHDLWLVPHIFLGGSIDMGAARDWQKEVKDNLSKMDREVVLLNPRRPQWTGSGNLTLDNPDFLEQVQWECHALSCSDIILMYFAPGSISPISLLELGLFAASKNSEGVSTLIVCCPDGYGRKGNVDYICKMYGIETCNSLTEMCDAVKSRLELIV